MAALLRIIARRPVLAFMVIGLGPYFLIVAIPPIVNAEILPFDLPLHGVLGGVLGVGCRRLSGHRSAHRPRRR